MRSSWFTPLVFGCSFACSDSSDDAPANAGVAAAPASGGMTRVLPNEPSPGGGSTPAAGAEASGTAAEDAESAQDGAAEAAPAMGATPDAVTSGFVVFMEPSTGFMTDEVHDADREIVHFDAALGAMVSSETGDAVSGWDVTGDALRWSGNRVRFQVRFGTEEGERRAYFTEAGPGTICNLTVQAPDVLFISATAERPPNP